MKMGRGGSTVLREQPQRVGVGNVFTDGEFVAGCDVLSEASRFCEAQALAHQKQCGGNHHGNFKWRDP